MLKKENIYKVGGVVRDHLMNIPSNDIDYVIVNTTAEEMKASGYSPIGAKAKVFLHPETKDEYALARKELSTGDSYHDFDFDYEGVTILEDLQRRDLSINAIAMDHKGNIIDPFNGAQDIKDKTLKHTSKAFKDDPLRLVRLARFYAKFEDFTVHPDTLNLCKEMSKNGILKSVTNNKLGEILIKTIKDSKQPSRFFYFLKDVGALEILFPRIYALVGQTQPKEHHPEGDSFVHSMLVMDKTAQMTSDVETIIASLIHDLGKGLTPKELLPKHHGHEKSGVPLVEEFCQRFQFSKRQRKLAVFVCKNHLKIHRIHELRSGKLYHFLKDMRIFQDDSFFDKLIICCRADNMGKYNEEYLSEQYISDIKEVLLSEKPTNIKNHQVIEQFYVRKINEYFKSKNSSILN
jgi:tRNA nucleotidyltransferase (CCA-adding enzyme)